MSSKISTEVIIGGRVYTLCGYESEGYLHQVASYINNKVGEFGRLADYRHFSPDMRAVLLELNIADDYFKEKLQTEKLEKELADRNQELSDLKEELGSLRDRLERMEKSWAGNRMKA